MLYICGLILLSSLSLSLGTDFKYSPCGQDQDANEDFKIDYIKLENPVIIPGKLKGGIKITVTKVPLPNKHYNVSLALTLTAFASIMPTVPCINGFGSCTYDLCETLETQGKKWKEAGKCGELPCSCADLKPGTYEFPGFEYDVDLKNVSPLFREFIYGDYNADIKLIRAEDSKLLACEHIEFTIAKKDECTGIFCGE